MKNLNLMKDHLSRDEMRTINGGLRDRNVGCETFQSCTSSSQCGDSACPRCVKAVGNTNEKACGA